MQSEDKKELRWRIVVATIVAACIVAIIAAFLSMNYQRTVSQNALYLEASTNQALERLDSVFENSQQSLFMASTLFEEVHPTDDEICNELEFLEEGTPFDYLAFETVDGTTYNSRGKVSQVQPRENPIKEAGVATVNDERIGEGLSIVFFEPVYDGDTYVGVMSGVWSNELLERTISTTYYNEYASTYLCNDEGVVIACSSTFVKVESDQLDISAVDSTDGTSVGELLPSLERGESMTFTYESPRGLGLAYMVKLSDHDWTLLRTYPATINTSIVERTNIIGIALIAAIIVVFICALAVVIVRASRKNKEITIKKDQFERVADASSQLFKRFAVLDLQNNIYEYIKGEDLDDRLPKRGKFTDFANFWVSQAVYDDEREKVRDMIMLDSIMRNFTPDVQIMRFEYRVNYQGEVRWLQPSMVCLRRDNEGHPASLLYAVQDVTTVKVEEARAREALEDAYRAAEQASRAKSDFLGSMSHDIRTPMNSIMGLTAIATMHINDSERVKDCLQKITVSSRHLLGLINEVLDMARIESGNIGLAEDDFDLPEAIENLLTIIHPQVAAKQQHLKVDTAGVIHEHVVGDFMRLQQVFVNIMGNSVKFTPEGGTIGLTIAEIPTRISGCACYQFTFTDTGCGMSEEFVERVFEPFARANDNRMTNVEGTGLGMSIVKSVVSLMNGSIDVQSKLGEGTTFVVTVHLKLREADLEDTSALCDLYVLVADNDQVACEGACEMLDEIGMVPDYVLSGDAAIARVRERVETPEEYSAVILDWKMPGKSGIETARELREILPDHVPIIILSAYDWMAIEQEARMAGIDAFVSKPMFKSRLVHVMNSLLVGGKDDEAERDDAAKEADLLRQADFSDKRILLVEDNELAASIGLDILSFTGAATAHAINGRVALEMLRDNPPGTFDLVLMDGQMPVMNGYEAARAIRSLGLAGRPDLATIPIVALTADAFADDMKRALNAGMNAHMSKPLEINTLVRVLREFLQ
ncbi:hybrid sensor histidine kinase/response regulator [Adlercreutzia sp. ZJ141]|uniref:hybrid sensor histidine kinase/response regulator n=1 Tax=Adlercreutzia sp. ZJ141 TaxID=2709406 RepID=UPI0013ED3077|nr:response regulator [Adlercreutzia sp. ZJ141]